MSATEFTGPIDNRRKKGDLVNMAIALGLTSTGTIKEIVPRIKAHVKDHQAELTSDPRFQKLVMYRPSAAASGGVKTKETGKTSADKVIEDMHEAHKTITAITG